jgi:hypothetical protein
MDANGYQLTKAFYAEVEQNEAMQVGCKSHHFSLYTWICELRNRVKAPVLDLPREHTMKMAFIGSPSTLEKCIDELAEWGIIEIVFKGKNQWSGPTKIKLAGSFLGKHCTDTEPAQNRQRTRTERAVNTTKTSKTGKNKKSIYPPQKSTLKIKFRDNVKLLQSELDTLVEKHGADFTDRCLDKLSHYKLSNGKTYRSDYGAINQWVIDAVNDKPGRSPTDRSPTDRSPTDRSPTDRSPAKNTAPAPQPAENRIRR